MRKKQDKNFVKKVLAEAAIGSEPILKDKIESKKSAKLIKMLNWYSIMSDEKSCNNWIIDYMKSHDYDQKQIALIKNIPNKPEKYTTSALCRMSSNGTILCGELQGIVEIKLSELLNQRMDEPKRELNKKPTVSVQDRVKSAAIPYINVVDDEIFSWFNDQKKKIEFSLYEFLRKEMVSSHIANHVRSFIIEQNNEFIEMMSGTDDQLNEAYEHISLKRKKQIQKAYLELISDVDRFLNNAKVSKARKPRKKKAVSAEKQINKLKYMKEYSKLKIKSIDPVNIIGSSQLWVYNTKYKTLAVYNALDRDGLKIKGTTLINYDENSSLKKTLRKPDMTIDRVLAGGKIVLKNVMSELTTKQTLVNGRINDDTILLKAIK